MRKSTIGLIDLNYFICMLLCVWMIFPYLYRNTSHIVIAALFIMWLFTAVFCKKKVSFNMAILWIAIYFMYILSYKFIGLSDVIFIKYIQQAFFWFPFVFYMFYEKERDYGKKKLFINVLLAVICISFIWTDITIYRDPRSTMMVNRVGGEQYLLTNVGETPYSFMGALIFLYSLYMLRSGRKHGERLVYIMLIISSACMIILMQRTITIIVLAAGIVYERYKSKVYNKGIVKNMVWKGVIIIVLLLVFLQYNNIVKLITPMIPSTKIVDRLNEIGRIFFGGSAMVREYSGSARINLFWVSIHTWLSSLAHFLFGIGYLNSSDLSSFSYVGGHSDLLDSLARHGIIGTMILLAAFFSTFRFLYCSIKSRSRYLILVFGLIFVMYGCVAGFLDIPAIGVAMFLIIPTGLQIKQEEEEKK